MENYELNKLQDEYIIETTWQGLLWDERGRLWTKD